MKGSAAECGVAASQGLAGEILGFASTLIWAGFVGRDRCFQATWTHQHGESMNICSSRNRSQRPGCSWCAMQTTLFARRHGRWTAVWASTLPKVIPHLMRAWSICYCTLRSPWAVTPGVRRCGAAR